MPTFVYISGPLTGDAIEANVDTAIDVANAMTDAGLLPYVPHLWFFAHRRQERSYDDWMYVDLTWLQKCDVLVRIPGISSGSDAEVAEANRVGIPVLVVGQDGSLEQIIKFLASVPSGLVGDVMKHVRRSVSVHRTEGEAR